MKTKTKDNGLLLKFIGNPNSFLKLRQSMHNAIIIDFEIIQIVRIEIFLFVVVSACSFHISSINRDSLGWIFCQIYFISQDGFQLINHSRWLHRCIRHNDIFITLFGILQIDNCRHLHSLAAVRQSQCCVISNE